MSSGGMAVENETPAKLLEDKSSMFSKLGEQVSLTNMTSQSKTTYFAMKESFFSFFHKKESFLSIMQ
jgi:hypothetical protein